ncbi:substrate-binding domain-containing protein [Faecalicatena sp. AGMB00832]|uniref:Ribokinase n=1 Tax=Faecalicatena faecalis TaxID=2726362 RepID=A0ABS6CZU4_9FIRM|nr:substrate-binding domain-containing protein [Faecalicatena faecalis]MCI6465847.1 PfkB family carbohydrate kinase [Faecalicatena sp.]
MNINDIAKLAGVSASTVSKVMNGKDKDISEETKKKVRKIIEEENYIPYLKYREKEGLKNHLIGLLVRRDNRERDALVMSAEKMAGQMGYNLVVSYADSQKKMEKSIDEMARRKIAGILVDSGQWMTGTRFENASVYLGETKEFDERQKATFYYRLSEAGKLAAERLIQAGHQKIACIIYKKDRSILNGYKLAMHEHNFPVHPVWSYEGETIEEIETYGIKQCLSENVTAIICGAQEIACCVCKVLERSRTAIPEELSVIAVGDGELLTLLGCGITAVRLPSEQMARDAVEYLVDMIQGDKQIEVTRRFPPAVIERGSIAEPAQIKQGEKIIVVGSMNMDVTIEVSRIPVNGETQIAKRVYVYPGGKGGNQAVGVGKLGGQVYMIGCLGNDMDGKELYTSLTENHVHMDGVLFDPSLPSGKAYINVEQTGESTIVVYPGANRNLSISHINRYKYLFESAKYCLLSLEIPGDIAEYTLKFCRRNKTKVILKPSAVEKIKEELLSYITYFVPNEHELNIFVPGEMGVEEKSEILLCKGVKNVIVTLGSRGCYFRNAELSMYFEGSGFEAVDTTGGADSFISALAVCLGEGKNIIQSIGFAIYASGLSVTRYGVQPALPDRKAVEIYEDEIYSKYLKKDESEEN